MRYSYHVLLISLTKIADLTICPFLEQNGFFLTVVNNLPSAAEMLMYFKLDGVVMDLASKNDISQEAEFMRNNGLSFAQRIKKDVGYKMPLIVRSDNNEDKISYLQAGGDDYISADDKLELLLKLKNFMGLYSETNKDANIIYFGSISFNPVTRLLSQNNKTIDLSHVESKLLRVLIEANGPISRSDLARILNINQRSVDVQVNRLRVKIEPNKKRPLYLQTIRNEGYMLHTNL